MEDDLELDLRLLPVSGPPDRNKDSVILEEHVDPEFVRRIPCDFARDHLLLGLVSDGDALRVAVGRDDPAQETFLLHNVGVRMGRPVEAVLTDPEVVARLIDAAYGAVKETDEITPAPGDEEADNEGIDDLIRRADRDLLSSEGKSPVVKLVDSLLLEALGRRSSDVHVQPVEDRVFIRYRVDGMLVSMRELPRKLLAALISRIKVMGRMDIAESRVPQDGRATVLIGDRAIDLRISTLPTSHGERAVLRLLDSTQELVEFQDLGMPKEVAERYLSHAQRSNGMVLLTGPTGSGKTTTLYATLRRVGTPQMNLMTIEDPIEYELSTGGIAISQAQVNTKKGVTFATGLRHLLRQDPDMVMVGEIRDVETARIAIQSSLTGHMVFSTLHTNDAPSAVTRLVDLGIESYLVAASISAVCAQRLVRLIHQGCHGRGCVACYETGFLGRTGLFELFEVTGDVRESITNGATLTTLREIATQQGMRSLRDEGLRLVSEGKTTKDEVERVVQEVV